MNDQPRNKDVGKPGHPGQWAGHRNSTPDVTLPVALPSAVDQLIAAYDAVAVAPHTEIYEGEPVPVSESVRENYRELISESAFEHGVLEIDEDGKLAIVVDSQTYELPVLLGIGGPGTNALKEGLAWADNRTANVTVTRAELESILDLRQ